MPDAPAAPSPPEPPPASRLVTSIEVARRKGCTGMAVRNAVKRGDLNAFKVGPVWAIADDDALESWTVQETGARLHRKRAGEAAGAAPAAP